MYNESPGQTAGDPWPPALAEMAQEGDIMNLKLTRIWS